MEQWPHPGLPLAQTMLNLTILVYLFARQRDLILPRRCSRMHNRKSMISATSPTLPRCQSPMSQGHWTWQEWNPSPPSLPMDASHLIGRQSRAGSSLSNPPHYHSNHHWIFHFISFHFISFHWWMDLFIQISLIDSYGIDLFIHNVFIHW